MRGDKQCRSSNSEAWGVEERCRKARLGVWRKGAGKRGLGCGGKVPESEAWGVEERCRKARLGVWRKGAGKQGLGCGGKVPESDLWSVEKSCRKAVFGLWRKGVGKRGLVRGMMSESVVWGAEGCRNAKFRSRRMPEYEASVVEKRCQKARLVAWRKGVKSEAWKVEERCRKAWFGVGVSRKGVGKRGLECDERVPESGILSVEQECRKV